MIRIIDRKFTAHYFFIGWYCWSIGVHVDVLGPLIEVHVPFGFVRIGWDTFKIHPKGWYDIDKRTHGYNPSFDHVKIDKEIWELNRKQIQE